MFRTNDDKIGVQAGKVAASACLFGLALLLGGYQNCSTKFDMAATDQFKSLNCDEGECGDSHDHADENRGLLAGHFDFDTAGKVYSSREGRTTRHEHAYDDTHDLTHVDFFNMRHSSHHSDRKFLQIRDALGGSTSKVFVITVANAELSPGGILEINGVDYPVVSYQNSQDAAVAGTGPALARFSLAGGATSTALSSLKLKFAKDAIVKGQLLTTVWWCPVENYPGAKGEYRNGALLVQIHEIERFKLNSKRVAPSDGGLVWEGMVFHHPKELDTCYGGHKRERD
ncbi:MAG TPA: hypothetical protein PLZ57_08815 [Pseudobdellovibrionaceae bacterium]|nr:hypothetical protein [Pseudobdellovibrionaceae bacterium]